MRVTPFKKMLNLTLLIIVALFYTGAARAADGKPLLAFLPGPFSNASQAYAARMFEKHAAEYGFELKVMDNEDPQVQAQNVQKFIDEGAEVIVINPNDIVSIIPSLKKAKEAGVTICLFSSDLPQQMAESRDIFCGVDDTVAGEVAAQAFISKFPDGARIVEIGGQNGHDAQLKRYQGFHKIIDNSNIEVLATQNCDAWSTEQAGNIMNELIVAFGDEIDGVFCHWDNGVTGIIQALDEAGMKDLYIVGVDGCKNGFQQILDGNQSVTIAQNIENIAKKTMECANSKLQGKEIKAVNIIPFDTITLNNINDYSMPEW